jgi:hypothetical protein
MCIGTQVRVIASCQYVNFSFQGRFVSLGSVDVRDWIRQTTGV